MAYRMISLTIQQSVILAKQALHPFEQALFEAEILLAFTLDQPRSYLHAWPEQCLSSAQMAQFMQYLEITLTYIFWMLRKINGSVLIVFPRLVPYVLIFHTSVLEAAIFVIEQSVNRGR